MFGIGKKKAEEKDGFAESLDRMTAPKAADQTYVSNTIGRALSVAVQNETFIGCLDGDAGFSRVALPDGVHFATNEAEIIGALQAKSSIGMMFENVPLLTVVHMAAPSGINFALQQEPEWTPSKTDEDENVTEYAAKVVVATATSIVTVTFNAAEGETRISPTAEWGRGTILAVGMTSVPK